MTGARYALLIMPMTLLIAGCSGADRLQSDAPTATATVTVTATPTQTPRDDPELIGELFPSAGATGAEESGGRPLPQLKLSVFTDGCGVIRSRVPKGVTYRNLTWTFRDRDGFQVLGRNALGERRYRYYLAGTYTVVLEAWAGDRYAPVSNEVSVHC